MEPNQLGWALISVAAVAVVVSLGARRRGRQWVARIGALVVVTILGALVVLVAQSVAGA